MLLIDNLREVSTDNATEPSHLLVARYLHYFYIRNTLRRASPSTSVEVMSPVTLYPKRPRNSRIVKAISGVDRNTE